MADPAMTVNIPLMDPETTKTDDEKKVNGTGSYLCNLPLQYKILVAIIAFLIFATLFALIIAFVVVNNRVIDTTRFPKISILDETLNGVYGEKQQPISASLFFQHLTIPATICLRGGTASSCFIQHVSQADTIIGEWALKKEDEKENKFFQLSGNSITILNEFEGDLKIKASMYRLNTDRYGFVLNLNGVPNITCIFQQLNESFSAATQFCKWTLDSIRYRLDKKDNYLLTTLNYNHAVKLSKGAVITITYFGTKSFIKENLTISFDGIIFF